MEVMLRNGEVVKAYYFSVEVLRLSEIYYTLFCFYHDELHKENKGVIGYFDDVNAAMDEYDFLDTQLKEHLDKMCEKYCGISLSEADLQKAKNE